MATAHDAFGDYYETHVRHNRTITAAALDRETRQLASYYACLMPQDRNAKILEIGCGYGAFQAMARRLGYRNVHGIDIDEEQVKVAIELGVDTVAVADASEFLSANRGEFDCIVAIDLIEHLAKQDAVEVLRLAHDALRERGRVLLQTLNGQSPFVGRLLYGDITHVFALTNVSACQLFRRAGFDDIEVHAMRPLLHGVASGIRLALWHLIELVLRIATAAQAGAWRGNIFTPELLVVAKR